MENSVMRKFDNWLERVNDICSETGHIEVALITIGEVLIHGPPDPTGLWIHRAIATALNDPGSENMRSGFRSGKYNSRGVHMVDPTGNEEEQAGSTVPKVKPMM